MYEVKQEDLIGDIKDFPIEVVQKMVDEQENQGHDANVKIFQEDATAGLSGKGFAWRDTEDGSTFWDRVIRERNWDLFFKKYPKEKAKQDAGFCLQDEVTFINWHGNRYELCDVEKQQETINSLEKEIEELHKKYDEIVPEDVLNNKNDKIAVLEKENTRLKDLLNMVGIIYESYKKE